MNYMTIVLVMLLVIYFICIIIRKVISKYMININKDTKFNINTNYLYDDFYENEENKEGLNLVGNLGIIRYNFMDETYESDAKILKLETQNNLNVLNISQTHCNFDIYLANNYENLVIHSLINNINDFKKCQEKIKFLNLQDRIKIHYGKYSDINNTFKEEKFDRIVMLESIGKVKNRRQFVYDLKSFIHNNGFIYIKTLVYKDLILEEELNKEMKNELFEKQKHMIDFWNYNFSTNQSIINDFYKSGYLNVKMKSISILSLLFTYNIDDMINLLKLYFVDLDMGIKNLNMWYILFTLNISHFIIN